MSLIRRQDVLITVVVFLLLAANLSHAQLIRGFVSGTVSDSAGAVVPGVQVTLTNVSTNTSRQLVTNGSGFYRFVAVEPGEYSIEFLLPGFETRKFGSVVVRTAQEIVLDQALKVGAVETDVSVLDSPGVELNKTTPTVESTLSERLTVELPLQIYSGARDITRLALLAPAVSRGPSFSEFSANGQRSRNNDFMLDGVDNNDLSVTLNMLRVVPEAVGEVQVQTVSYSAEFGRSSGAQFSAITRRGSNAYHGEAWEYHRGNWMEPVSLANKRAGLTQTPRFDLNQFGGDAGGPILKDRTFFFGLLDVNRRREAPSANNATQATIPTPAGFAALQSVPLGPGETATARQSALAALSFLPDVYPTVSNISIVPAPTTINGVAIQMGNIRIPIARPADFWYNVGRVDHRLSDKDTISYRYHFDQSNQPNAQGNSQFGTRFMADQSIRRQNHALSSTHVFSGRFLNEARLAYTRGRLSFPEHDPVSSTVIIGGLTLGGLSGFPQGRIEQLYQFQDVASYLADRHSLKFGVDVRRNKLFNRTGTNSKGTWTFGTFADFINSSPTNLVQAVNESTFNAAQWNNAYFFQDDIKLGRHLTLNAGLRYEYSTVPFGFFGATDPAILAVGVPGPPKTDKNNWAPRVGFAFGKGANSIRGGFGMGYDVLFYNILAQASGNYPRVVSSTTAGSAAQNLFPTLAPKVATVPPLNPLTSTFVNVPADTQRPTTNFWSLSLQRQLSPHDVIEVGYLGNRSYHQIRQRDTNAGVLTDAQAATVLASGVANSVTIQRLNPAWGPRTQLEAAAKAEYHAGYAKFDHRFSKGLIAGGSYTWSANFSDNDEAFGGNDVVSSSPQVAQNILDYHNEWSRSAFDRPHRFVVDYLYEVPWFSSGWPSQALGRILGGWQISGVTEAQSGQPFTIRTGVDSVGSLAGAFPGRPNYKPDGIFLKDPDTDDLRTFTIPINGTGIVTAPLGPNGLPLANTMPHGGNLGRNTFRGPSFVNWNFSLMKKVNLREDVQLQIRSDFANLWNHNNFPNPVQTMSSSTFGQNTAPLITDSRQILLSAKLKF